MASNDERDEQQRDQPARFKPGQVVRVDATVRGHRGTHILIKVEGDDDTVWCVPSAVHAYSDTVAPAPGRDAGSGDVQAAIDYFRKGAVSTRSDGFTDRSKELTVLADAVEAQVRRVTELEQEVQDLEAGCAHCGDLGYVVITATGEEADCCCYVGQVRSQARELAYERDRATAVEDKHGKFCQAAVRALGADELGGASIIAEIESQARRLEAATAVLRQYADHGNWGREGAHSPYRWWNEDPGDGWTLAAAFLAGDAPHDDDQRREP